MDNTASKMRFPRNEAYCAGWNWAGDSLTWMTPEAVEDLAAGGACADLTDSEADAEMAYEGVLDRVRAAA